VVWSNYAYWIDGVYVTLRDVQVLERD